MAASPSYEILGFERGDRQIVIARARTLRGTVIFAVHRTVPGANAAPRVAMRRSDAAEPASAATIIAAAA